MRRTVSVDTRVSVEIDLEEIQTDYLIEELESRGLTVIDHTIDSAGSQLLKIYHLRRLGKSFDHELDKYLSEVLGVVV